jgi:hypothetical protein
MLVNFIIGQNKMKKNNVHPRGLEPQTLSQMFYRLNYTSSLAVKATMDSPLPII